MIYRNEKRGYASTPILLKGILWWLVIFLPSLVVAQKFTISGTLKDANTGENLIGASIYEMRSGVGTTSNNYGFLVKQFEVTQ